MTNLCMLHNTHYALSQPSNKLKHVKKLLHCKNSLHKDVCKSTLIQMELFTETWRCQEKYLFSISFLRGSFGFLVLPTSFTVPVFFSLSGIQHQDYSASPAIGNEIKLLSEAEVNVGQTLLFSTDIHLSTPFSVTESLTIVMSPTKHFWLRKP